MNFSDKQKEFSWDEMSAGFDQIDRNQVEIAISRQGRGGIEDLIALLSPIAAEDYLEEMAQLSYRITRKRFGQTLRLFAPMYLSNECNNICDYCGFSMNNQIPRKTLTDAEILREAGIL